MYIKDIPKKATIEQLLKILPKTTYNSEPFGIMLMPSGSNWSCSYYTHYSKKIDDRFGICIGKTPQSALKKMIVVFIKTGWKNALQK